MREILRKERAREELGVESKRQKREPERAFLPLSSTIDTIASSSVVSGQGLDPLQVHDAVTKVLPLRLGRDAPVYVTGREACPLCKQGSVLFEEGREATCESCGFVAESALVRGNPYRRFEEEEVRDHFSSNWDEWRSSSTFMCGGEDKADKRDDAFDAAEAVGERMGREEVVYAKRLYVALSDKVGVSHSASAAAACLLVASGKVGEKEEAIDTPPPPPSMPLSCDLCGERFGVRYKLDMHKKRSCGWTAAGKGGKTVLLTRC